MAHPHPKLLKESPGARGPGRANISYMSLQNLARDLHEKHKVGSAITCVAIVSALVRRESWDESKKEVTHMPRGSVKLSALRLCGDG